MKIKSTKSALLMSFTSLLLCFAMLIGCTFAWFTDTATASVCQIKSGKLDVDLVDAGGNTVVGSSLQFKKADGGEEQEVLWEPGCTYELPAVKVKNNGNLALKYTIQITGVTGAAKLLNAIEFTVDGCALSGTTGTLEPNALSNPITIKGHMKEDAGNEYQGLTLDGIAITVYATQVEHEYDSTTKDYDASAFAMMPQGTPVASVGEVKVEKTEGKVVTKGADQKLTNGDMEVTLPAGVELATGGDYAEAPNYATDGTTTDYTDGKTNVKQGFEFVNDQGSDKLTATVGTNESVAYFDLKLPVATTNTKLLKVEKQYIKGATVNDVYHNGIKMSKATDANTPGGVEHDANGNNGAYWYDSASGKMTLWVFHASPIDVIYEIPAAKIGDKMYDTLEAAFAAVKSGETITLLKDTAGNGVSVPSGSNFTVNFNGFTYDIDGETVGSAGTKTNGFQLLQGSTVTFKNGKLTSSKAKILIQNYCTLTLDNMTLDGTGLVAAKPVLSTNNGSTLIKDTVITAKSGMAAFDVGTFGDYTGNTVTVEGKSVINGNIEFGAWNNNAAATKLNITGGTVNGAIVETSDADKTTANFTGNITGGTFSSNPSAYVKRGYEATANEAGTVWTVTKKAVSYGAKTENNTVIPQGAKVIDNELDLIEAIKAGGTVYVAEGVYSIQAPKAEIKTGTVTIIGAGSDKTTLKYGSLTPPQGEAGSCYLFDGSTVTFKDVTLEDVNGQVNYKGFVRVKNITFENCVLKSMMTYCGGDGADSVTTFKNCTYDTPDYNMWAYGTNGTYNYENCLFKSANGKFVNAYRENGNGPLNINFTNCRFEAPDGVAPYGAILIKTKQAYVVSFDNCETSFEKSDVNSGKVTEYKATDSYSELYLVAQTANAGTKVTVDGVQVYPAAN